MLRWGLTGIVVSPKLGCKRNSGKIVFASARLRSGEDLIRCVLSSSQGQKSEPDRNIYQIVMSATLSTWVSRVVHHKSAEYDVKVAYDAKLVR
jgi:hypothetical protein